MRRLVLVGLATAWLGCALDEQDVETALRDGEELNAGNVADATCGFSTFGLHEVALDGLHIDGQGAGSATVKGVAADGPNKGKLCAADITFTYVKGRRVTQGVNGESEKMVAVIQNVKRK